MRKPDPKLLEFLERYDAGIADLVLAARKVVLAEAPSATELVHDVKYAVVLSYTFSGRFKETFCQVVTYRHHINVAFPRGAELPDPDGTLEGSGILYRHISVKNPAGLADPSLLRLVRTAVERAEIAGGPPPATKRSRTKKRA